MIDYMPGKTVEAVCADIAARVAETFLSVRYYIEKLKPRVPRALLNALCLGTLRNYKLLEYALERCGYQLPATRTSRRYWLALIGAYETVFRRNYVSLEKVEAATRMPRNVLQCLRGLHPGDVNESGLRRLAILYSVPLWVVERLAKLDIPGGLEALLKSFQEPTPLWIRFNRRRIGLKAALEELRRLGIEAKPDPILDDVVEAVSVAPGSLARLPPHLFYVQDRAATLAAHLLEKALPLSGLNRSSVLDLFSAPGNKLAHFTWRVGVVYGVAIDVSWRRLIDEYALHRRQRVGVVDYIAGDARHPPIRRGFHGIAIVDPDCSSIGRIGHSPETRLFLEAAGPHLVARMQRLQLRSLERLFEAMDSGVVVYTTCTLTREENEDVVSQIAASLGVEVLDATRPLIGVEGYVKGTQRVYPHTSRCTGGFAALLWKTRG